SPSSPPARPLGSSLAPLADAAQLEHVFPDAVMRGAPDLAQRALERAGVELPRAAALGADDGVMAALLFLGAGAHGGGTHHAVQEAQLEQRGDVAVDGDAVHADALRAEQGLQLSRAEWAGRPLEQLEQRAARAAQLGGAGGGARPLNQLEQRAPRAGDAPAVPAQRRLRAGRESHAERSSTDATVLHPARSRRARTSTPRANSAGGGSSETTRCAPEGKSKKDPGGTSPPASSKGDAHSSSVRERGIESTSLQPPSARRTSQGSPSARAAASAARLVARRARTG